LIDTRRGTDETLVGKACIYPADTYIYIYIIHTTSQRCARWPSMRVMHTEMPLSKNIGDVEYDQHLATTGSARFYADQINLRIVMVQVMTRKSSKIPRWWLDRSRDLMSKWIMKSGLNRHRCHWISMAEKDTFLILRSIGLCLSVNTMGMSYVSILDSRIAVVVYHAMVGHDNVLMVMWSTVPNELRYILEMGIELGIGDNG